MAHMNTRASNPIQPPEQRPLGSAGLRCSALGLGCMSMSHIYGPAEDAESIATLQLALDLGINLFDTADVYGFNANERLLGEAFAGIPRISLSLASKFGMRRDSDGTLQGIDGSPAYAQEACEASLKRLGTDYLDLYYLHRVDPQVPLEESIGGMARLVEQGKVRYLGLCEVGPEQIRAAHAEHPLSAVQSEYSLWSREPEEQVLPVLRELGIGFVAYSPLGRGMLSGAIASAQDLGERDYRRTFPRYQGENLEHNAAMVQALRAIAARLDISVAQLSLAWLLAQASEAQPIVPIPGTKRRTHLKDNATSTMVSLSKDDIEEISNAYDASQVKGERYRASAMKRVSG